jgi:eukaryotic-like serine/threonine-protein kinase
MLLGRYRTLIPLGRGSMSEVHIGTAVDRRELVILKQMRATADAKTAARFEEEMAIAGALDHPNVVRGLGRGEADGRPFLVLEYVDGQPVDQLLRAAKAEKTASQLPSCLPWILSEALAGLDYAHNLRLDGRPLDLVHRDFNPQNVVVDYSGNVKVLDFGIAKTTQQLTRTTTGIVKGKLRYMAPEQALEMRIDRRADVFSAGVMLFEFLSGAAFWGQRSDNEIFDDLVGGVYPTKLAAASAGANEILACALARAASDRYPTAAEMREDVLREFAQGANVEEIRARTASIIGSVFAERRERMAQLIERTLAAATP